MASARQVSKAIFGNADRLEVASFIASSSDGLIYATEISQALGIPQNRARAQLMAFAEAGLLNPLPRDHDRRAFFVRQNDGFWDAMKGIHDSLSEVHDPD
jgi:DNA-binding MarR family transcriptional regulator